LRAFILTILLTGCLGAQPVSHGPDVGSKVPQFAASDQNGVTKTLQSIMGPKGAMIVFYRSSDW